MSLSSCHYLSQEVIVVVVVEVGEGVLVLAGLERGTYEEQSRRGGRIVSISLMRRGRWAR